jgi:hypothetical protein
MAKLNPLVGPMPLRRNFPLGIDVAAQYEKS